MRNLDKILYSYKHKKIVKKLAEKYHCSETFIKRLNEHDLDKMFLLLFYDKKDIENAHRDISRHHDNNIEKTEDDYIEMVLDWESARYTKPDKPLNAYDTLYKYYPHLEDKILPILKQFKIDKSNMPMDEEILKYSKELDSIKEEGIKEIFINYIKNL